MRNLHKYYSKYAPKYTVSVTEFLDNDGPVHWVTVTVYVAIVDWTKREHVKESRTKSHACCVAESLYGNLYTTQDDISMSDELFYDGSAILRDGRVVVVSRETKAV